MSLVPHLLLGHVQPPPLPSTLLPTLLPTWVNTSMSPSRSMVARICSLPGVMVKGTLALIPALSA